MSEQYGQIVGGFESTQKLSGDVVPLKQIGGGVDKAAAAYHEAYINGVELIGNKTSDDLHIVACKTSAEWAALTTLVSMPGEVYVYSDGGTDAQGNPIPMIKVGDGNAYVVDLPFTTAIDFRITQADIDNWNGKVSVRIEGDRLIFY